MPKTRSRQNRSPKWKETFWKDSSIFAVGTKALFATAQAQIGKLQQSGRRHEKAKEEEHQKHEDQWHGDGQRTEGEAIRCLIK